MHATSRSYGSGSETHAALLREASELTAIFTASYRTARLNLKTYPTICAIVSRLIWIFIRCRALFM